MQKSLVRSHAAGMGPEVETEVVRAMMVLRARSLSMGYSGVRPLVAEGIVGLLNASLTPVVPEYGSLGASGDLAPLAHAALPLLGEGVVRDADGELLDAADALAAAGLAPIELMAKEGLALINGTDGILGMLVLALRDFELLLKAADLSAALSVEALLGTDRAFAEDLVALRPQPGQQVSAANLRRLLADSAVVASHRYGDTRVQDAYSLRCAPQVNGAARDALGHAGRTADYELESAIDNPMVMPDGRVESCGNFHGAPLGLACDLLAIASADVGAIAERRTDRLLDKVRSEGLPPFLADDAGVNSGLMIGHYTQAAMVAENRRLAVPASSDTLSTSASQEDHVSMAWGAARKLRDLAGEPAAHPRDRDHLRRSAASTCAAIEGSPPPAPPPPATACAPTSPASAPTAGSRQSSPPPRSWSGPARWSPRSRRRSGSSNERRSRNRRYEVSREIHAPHGSQLSCKGWPQEAAMRMLMNNLDPAVAERPEDLVVYGGTGRAARSWEAYDAIIRSLKTLEGDETLLVQSGKPVGVMRTHEWSPRVLIANSNLVGDWDNWDEFRKLEAEGLTMYGQMTAGSWIYIGSQGIVQGTYECFAEIARRRHGGSLSGTITVTAGLGGMGGAQPLAITMNGGVALCIEVDRERIVRRLETGYLDEEADDLEDAVRRCEAAKREGRALSVGLCANAVDALPALLARGFEADIVTDQTSAHDPLNGYVPNLMSLEEADRLRVDDPDEYVKRSRAAIAAHCAAMVEFLDRGAEVFDYGNSLRAEARLGGFERAFDYPGFVPAYVRPLFCEGKGPFRWVALSGDPADIAATDAAVLDELAGDEALERWIRLAGERIAFQGLPARICWAGYGERHRLGLRFNEMVRSGELKGPIVIGRDHLDSGSVASPYRETEAMADGSDAIADWPLLNALVNTSAGASWVSIHDGGGVGIGRSLHAGMVCVADGTDLAGEKLERVLQADPGMGVIRHADAGYDRAIEVAAERGVRVPMREGEYHPGAFALSRAYRGFLRTHRCASSSVMRCSRFVRWGTRCCANARPR